MLLIFIHENSNNQSQIIIKSIFLIDMLIKQQQGMKSQQYYITTLLKQLQVSPKHATLKIDAQYHKNSKFMEELTAYITGQSPYILDEQPTNRQTLLRLALTTFNSLTCRFLSAQKSISDYFLVDEYYEYCKRIIFCNKTVPSFNISNHNGMLYEKLITFKAKTLVIKSLTLFFENSSINYSEFKQLKQCANKYEALDALLLILQAIINSNIQQIIKIKSIGLLFQPIINAISQNIKTILIAAQPFIIFNMQDQEEKEVVSYSQCFYVVEYWIRLAYDCCKMLRTITNHSQYETMSQVYSGKDFLRILVDLLYWKFDNPQGQIICEQDIHENGNKFSKTVIVRSYKINKVKSIAFSIIQCILAKSSKEYNLLETDNPLMSRIPNLVQDILREIQTQIQNLIAVHKNPYDKQFANELNTEMISKMFGFLAECAHFADCIAFFTDIVLKRSFIEILFVFLVPINLQIDEFENQPDRFADYLENVVSSDSQINPLLPRYSVTRFVQVCCNKVDGFTTFWFEACFKSLVFCLNSKLQTDYYSNLTIVESQFDGNPIGIINGQLLLGCETCLMGILVISGHVLYKRPDLQSTFKQLIKALCIHNLGQFQQCIFYQILSVHCSWIEEEPQQDQNGTSILLQYSRFIRYIYEEMDEEQSSCFVVGLNFVERICQYLVDRLRQGYDSGNQGLKTMKSREIVQGQDIDFNHNQETSMAKIYETILIEYIWLPLIPKIKNSKSFYFFETVTEMTSTLQSQSQKELFDPTFCSHMRPVLEQALIACCQKLSWYYRNPNHDELLCFKIHHSIKSLVQQFHTLINIEFKKTKYDRRQHYQKICSIIEHLIQQVLDPKILNSNGQYYAVECFVEQDEIQSLIEIVGVILGWSVQLSTDTLSLLVDNLIKKPFCQYWLQTICYYICQTYGNFTTNQSYNINRMLQDALQDNLQFLTLPEHKKFTISQSQQSKVNSLCVFLLILCEYCQPQQFHKTYELIRINLLKLIHRKFEAQQKKTGHGIVIQPTKWKPLPITIIRMFHVYLYNYKLEPNPELLTRIASCCRSFDEQYTIIEAVNLILCFRSSFEYLSQELIENILDMIVVILKRLYFDSNSYDQNNQIKWQISMREMSLKTIKACKQQTPDPYDMLRQMVSNNPQKFKINNQNLLSSLKQINNVKIVKGEPRRLINLKKDRNY